MTSEALLVSTPLGAIDIQNIFGIITDHDDHDDQLQLTSLQL